jgi:hypothetical protein
VPDQGPPTASPVHHHEPLSLDQSALALATLLSPDNVFTDPDWLGEGTDGWRLDDPATMPLSGPVEVADAALAALCATEGSGGD